MRDNDKKCVLAANPEAARRAAEEEAKAEAEQEAAAAALVLREATAAAEAAVGPTRESWHSMPILQYYRSKSPAQYGLSIESTRERSL